MNEPESAVLHLFANAYSKRVQSGRAVQRSTSVPGLCNRAISTALILSLFIVLQVARGVHCEEAPHTTSPDTESTDSGPPVSRQTASQEAPIQSPEPTVSRRDRHAGYYYPMPTSEEVYIARAVTMSNASRARRLVFCTEVTNQMVESAYAPTFAMFAKGADAEKLIITSLSSDRYNTLYRMRGLLAQLTARARQTPLFLQYQVEDRFTFLDLLKLLGFTQLTITDGDAIAHQIRIQ